MKTSYFASPFSGNLFQPQGSDEGLELTPLLDIVFLVVAFLLLTANARLLQLPVTLPSVAEADAAVAQPHMIQVAVHAQAPHFQLDDHRYPDWPSMQAALDLALTDDTSVRVQPAQDAPVQPLMQLLAHLHARQVTDTQLLMTPDS